VEAARAKPVDDGDGDRGVRSLMLAEKTEFDSLVPTRSVGTRRDTRTRGGVIPPAVTCPGSYS
jgi:hypothetical protein